MIHLYTHTHTHMHAHALTYTKLTPHTHLQHSNIHCTCLLHWWELPHIFWCNKRILAATTLLPQHNYVCRDKIFLLQQKLLPWQNFYHDKHIFVATKDMFCCDKYVCCDGSKLVTTKIIFVATKTCLSQQKLCRHKHTFVATKDVFCHDKNDTCGSSRQW